MLPLHPLSARTKAAMAHGGLDVDAVTALIGLAIREDLLDGLDVTSEATIPAGQRSHGSFGARAEGIVAGLPVAAAVIEMLCGPEASEVEVLIGDGSRVAPGDVLATVTGPTSRLLTAERTALNFLCHLSGVATLTGHWVDALEGTSAMVHDTRKTNPGMRSLEKYAVRCGGGVNHRMALSDMALVKDNHVVAAGGIEEAIGKVKQLDPSIPVEIEVDTLDALRVALRAGVDEILIDNFTLDMMREAVDARDEMRPEVRLEASGGLTSETARAVARTGVDLIAVGELTHSARVLDIGLDLETVL